MTTRWTTILAGAAALGVVALASACGDDDNPMGPQFGDLVFDPSLADLGSGRDVTFQLRNASGTALGPIAIGNDFIKQTTQPDSVCNGITLTITPSTIASLGPGAESQIGVQVETAGVSPALCPPAKYDADVFAAVDQRILGSTTVRFDWDGSPP